MSGRYKAWISYGVLLVLTCSWRPVWAASVDVIVTDSRSKPVEDAVVYATPLGSAPIAKRTTTAVMDQSNKEFVPYVLPVEVGASVRFPNRDNIKHHVYSVSPAKKFELPLYSGVQANPVVFSTPGEVVLGCNIHDWMVAYVYVLSTPLFGKSGGDGRAQIENVPPGDYEIRVWHPRINGASEPASQRVTVVEGAAARTTFALKLKRDWRPARRGYEGATP